jgi:hypothetical protein
MILNPKGPGLSFDVVAEISSCHWLKRYEPKSYVDFNSGKSQAFAGVSSGISINFQKAADLVSLLAG